MTDSSPDETPTMVEGPGAGSSSAIPERYVVEGRVGKGATGEVYRATDKTLSRPVALKTIQIASDADRSGSMREATAMARLSHPNVVHVYDVVMGDGAATIVMELVEGSDLRTWLRRLRRSPEQIIDRFRQAAQGLHAAHRAGIVHLDFKPANALIDAHGTVKVADFGIARLADIDGYVRDAPAKGGVSGGVASWGVERTEHGLVAGTPRYMAPEQHEGKRCDAQADVYAFCVSLWEALEGKPPFRGGNANELWEQKCKGPPAWEGPNLPDGVEAALRRGLAPETEERWRDMAPLIESLGESPSVTSARRRRGWRGGVIAGAGVLGLAGLWAAGRVSDEPGPPPPVVSASPSLESPALQGYGTDSTFGDGGTTCRVTALTPQGPGSLRQCLDQHEGGETPTRIVFDVSGTIALDSNVELTRPFLTLDGFTAPAPGITIASRDHGRVGQIRLTDDPDTGQCAHDVLVQGVRFLGTWDGNDHTEEQTTVLDIRAIRVDDCMRNIVLNRDTFFASPDAAGDMIGDIEDVTVQYCAFLRSHHPMDINDVGKYGKRRRISLHHNLFAYFHERAPQVQGNVRDLDIIENVFLNWSAYDFGGGYAIRIRCRDGKHCPDRMNMIGNHWLGNGAYDEYALVFGSHPTLDDDDGPIAERLFMADNVIPAGNPNFGLAPGRFLGEQAGKVPRLGDASSLAEQMLPNVGVQVRTDLERSIFQEAERRLLAED